MSAEAMAPARWDGRLLRRSARIEPPTGDVVVADSWLVVDGTMLALDLHRERFLRTATDPAAVGTETAAQAPVFWDAAIGVLPRQGTWFPRVEVRRAGDATSLWVHVRPAGTLTRSVVIRSLVGDPRRSPLVKGPDLEALLRARGEGQRTGAGESVILSPQGHVIEGCSTSILWWRGDAIGVPSREFDRVDSVTARVVETLASARGIPVLPEAAAPADLDGLEVWALSALHGPRIVTRWFDGPALAEQPGRLGAWRDALHALRRPLPALQP